MKAIGVRAFAAALRDQMPLAAAVAQGKTESRRYAKRQTTWFRHQFRDWPRVAV
jgi:tRNA dimethylallyltransferase